MTATSCAGRVSSRKAGLPAEYGSAREAKPSPDFATVPDPPAGAGAAVRFPSWAACADHRRPRPPRRTRRLYHRPWPAWSRGGRHRGARGPRPAVLSRPSLSTLLASLLAAVALLGFAAVPASAHAEVLATTPASGTSLDQAPTTVSVRFSEPVQVATDSIRVLAADGTRVDRGDAAAKSDDSNTVAATVRTGLAQGSYTVAWRVTSADSHPIHGAFAFAVGEAQAAAAPLADADRGADAVVASLVHITRGIGYLGLALLVGAAGLGLLLDGAADRSTLGKQARAGGLTLTLSAAVGLLAQGPYAAGTGLGSLFDPALLHNTLSGRTGVAEALRVVLAAALTLTISGRSPVKQATATASDEPTVEQLAVATSDRSTTSTTKQLSLAASGGSPAKRLTMTDGAPTDGAPTDRAPAEVGPTYGATEQPSASLLSGDGRPGGPWTRPVSYAPFVPLVLLAATFSATGHAAAGKHAPAAFTADLLHLMAMGLWLGGLVGLAALCTSRAVSGPVPPSAFTATLRRFSPLAACCVGVLAVTGTLQAVRQLGSLDNLLSTGWGRYLLAKLAVILVVLALATKARGWTHRHVAHDREPSAATPATPAVLSTMRRTLALEASVGVVVLALSTLLAGSPPPSDRPATATATAAAQAAPSSPARLHTTYDTGGPGGSGTATAVLTPRPDGSTDVELSLVKPDKSPAQPVEFTAAMSLPALEIGPLPLDLRESAPGHWKASTTLAPKGKWELELTIRTSDFDQTTVNFPATAG